MKPLILTLTLFLALSTQRLIAKEFFVSPTSFEIAGGDSAQSKDPISSVLSAYLELKNALAKDEEQNVVKGAKALFKAVEEVDMKKLSPDQHKAWMTYQKKLSYDAEHIKGTADMDHQREHFVSLSKNMHEVEKAFNSNSVTLYYQFCPMANDGKGAYWLSENEKILNPYMGKKMPTCGSTKETIKSPK
jgi:uncharacterized protein (DUF885 family)